MTTIPITFTLNIPIESLKQAISEAIQQGIGKPESSGKWHTREEAAAILRMDKQTLSRRAKSGNLPDGWAHKMVGRKHLFMEVESVSKPKELKRA